MTGRGFGIGVVVEGAREPRAIAAEPVQAADELVREPAQIVPAELVDRDEDDERWLCPHRRCRDRPGRLGLCAATGGGER